MKLFSDTSEKVRRIHDEMLRRKTPEESFRMAQQLTLFAQQLAFDTLRDARPDLSDDEVWLKLAADRLGADMVRKIYASISKAS
ncbi:MAG: hypothetical protein QOJ98_2674 [Acidobacteriota bacterium]|jgi:hypothetical protein|nr:hypothetical protein [Acidobacteriota bacterium]